MKQIMKKDRSLIFLIIANLVPLIGLFFLDWSVFSILFFYWLESVVVGFYNILKMQYVKEKIYKKIPITLLFLFHYSFFMMFHLAFIFAVSYIGAKTYPTLDSFKISNIFLLAIPFLVSHGISFYANFLGKKEYKQIKIKEQMFQPYSRITLMHVTIIIGALIASVLSSNVFIIFLFIFLKLSIDIITHNKEHGL